MPTPGDLFQQAAFAYREDHQSCLHCQQPHSVFYTVTAEVEEYRCYQCGLFLAFHRKFGSYLQGQDLPDSHEALFDESPGLLATLEDHPALRAG